MLKTCLERVGYLKHSQNSEITSQAPLGLGKSIHSITEGRRERS